MERNSCMAAYRVSDWPTAQVPARPEATVPVRRQILLSPSLHRHQNFPHRKPPRVNDSGFPATRSFLSSPTLFLFPLSALRFPRLTTLTSLSVLFFFSFLSFFLAPHLHFHEPLLILSPFSRRDTQRSSPSTINHKGPRETPLFPIRSASVSIATAGFLTR